MFAWLFKRKPEIICIHGHTPFLRHLKAAMLFQERLHKHKAGTIVCSPKAVVSILNSLALETPDEMRWWTSDKKWNKGLEIIQALPGVTFSETPNGDNLVWVDGEDKANGMKPSPVTIFTGSPKEDPFYTYARTTYSVGKYGVAESWATGACEYCSSWRRK